MQLGVVLFSFSRRQKVNKVVKVGWVGGGFHVKVMLRWQGWGRMKRGALRGWAGREGVPAHNAGRTDPPTTLGVVRRAWGGRRVDPFDRLKARSRVDGLKAGGWRGGGRGGGVVRCVPGGVEK